MCDYSLMGIKNRLANAGDELQTHRFGTGSVGLASKADKRRLSAWATQQSKRRQGLLGTIQNAITSTVADSAPVVVPAVCILPGAQLALSGIPKEMQDKYGVGSAEPVTFCQTNMKPYHYRDAFRFPNGKEVLLQEFPVGVGVTVLSLENATPREELVEEFAYAGQVRPVR